MKNAFYLLTLFKFQLDPGLDAIACVLICLLQGKFHEVLVVCPRQVPTDENDHIGRDLPDQVLLGPRRRGQADAQHDGVGGGGEHAGDDGISHVEGQHGVHHEDDEEEERHLWEKNTEGHRESPFPRASPLLPRKRCTKHLKWHPLSGL